MVTTEQEPKEPAKEEPKEGFGDADSDDATDGNDDKQ